MRILTYTDGRERMDEVFKALGDPIRLRILRMLAENGEVCVCRIVEELEMNQPAVSHHMAKLKQAGLLNFRKEGQWIHYSLRLDALKSGPLAFMSEIVDLAQNSSGEAQDSCCK